MTKIVSLEEWRPIEGHEGFYEVSNLGRVRSLDRVVETSTGKRKHKGKLLKQARTASGYPIVCLRKEGKQLNQYVHRLVAVAFLGQPPEGHVVCHGPKGQQCNKVTNLSWGTMKKNHGPDKLRDGTDGRGEKNPRAKLNEMQVRVIRRLIESKTMTSREIGEIFGVTRQTITNIKTGRIWKHLKPAKA
jgi:DNA-binding XRE family transcriptional regulator